MGMTKHMRTVQRTSQQIVQLMLILLITSLRSNNNPLRWYVYITGGRACQHFLTDLRGFAAAGADDPSAAAQNIESSEYCCIIVLFTKCQTTREVL